LKDAQHAALKNITPNLRIDKYLEDCSWISAVALRVRLWRQRIQFILDAINSGSVSDDGVKEGMRNKK
jgi:hypothetical protein